jgi:hypothetical protein
MRGVMSAVRCGGHAVGHTSRENCGALAAAAAKVGVPSERAGPAELANQGGP